MTYRWLTGMADALRASGVVVVEHDGWKQRGRPADQFDFNPKAVIMHHDASAEGPSPGEPAYIIKGRPPLDPGPLAQLWVSYYGVWHVLAAGRANHAGVGQAWGAVATDEGNRDAVGVEWDHTTGEALPAPTRVAIVTGLAALLKYLKADPKTGLLGHLEYTSRKVDPDAVALPMDQLRKDVAVKMAPHPKPPKPGGKVTISDADAAKIALFVFRYLMDDPLSDDPDKKINLETAIKTLRNQSAALYRGTAPPKDPPA